MLGAYLTFALVLAIVAAYMFIVHKALVSAEEPQDEAREAKLREGPPTENRPRVSRPQYAH